MPPSQPPSEVVAYSPEQQRIIDYRGGHIQVVACAGSGKTETVSMRVARIIKEGAAPSSIVAFTFTNAAAASLKTRILAKGEEIIPGYNLDKLSPMFVGTIHSFCLRFLQERIPSYAAFDLFEDHRLVGLLNREYFQIGFQELQDDLNTKSRTKVIDAFLESADVVENEMIPPKEIKPPKFRKLYQAYEDMLDRYHVLTHNQCIGKAVRELEDPQVFAPYHKNLKHLIVDEFQDINPAQARLIELLGRKPVQVCVVGDDDQAIYQWRGSSVEYIQNFKQKFKAESETLGVNRRSREQIVTLAARFAEKSIPKRLPKKIEAKREGDAHAVTLFSAPTAADEAGLIADAIKRMQASGIAYKNVAILLRSVRTSGGPIMEALEKARIPYNCAGRTGLFYQAEAELLGRVYAYLAGRDDFYNARTRARQPNDLDAIAPDIKRVFDIPPKKMSSVRKHLEVWREKLPGTREADLVGSLYQLLNLFGVRLWDHADPDAINRLGTLARFSELLADFESVTRRARPVEDRDGAGKTMRGGISGGENYLKRLADYIGFYAQTEYEDFGGEPDFDLDGVTISTVHAAKGLEWPVVFVPCMTARRFPSKMTGTERNWLIPRKSFPAARYEGSDPDERRLFYVAVTRARDHLYISSHVTPNVKAVSPSPYFLEVGGDGIKSAARALWTPKALPARKESDDKPTFSFSDLAFYFSCPLSYRYRLNLGFQPTAAKELGYGKAVHHILRRMADFVKHRGRLPKNADIEKLFDGEFYLPYADKPAYEQMRVRARQLVGQYVTDFADDLGRVWEVERAFELHLAEANVSGRADVILDKEGGQIGALALVDYKTKPDPHRDPIHLLQLAIYAAAGRGEGINVQAAYLHDLTAAKGSARQSVAAGVDEGEAAKQTASGLARGIRAKEFEPKTGKHCQGCDVRLICPHGPN